MRNNCRATRRRKLQFANLAEAIEDAETLAAGPVELLGNWSLGKVLVHLARGLHAAIDGIDQRPPWYAPLVGKFILRRILTRGMPAGFQLSGAAKRQLVPREEIAVDEALAQFRAAVERFEREPQRRPHLIFGSLTADQWRRLQLRHAELHLSFVLSAQPGKECSP